jgi:DNA-binding NtrC family response regulator
MPNKAILCVDDEQIVLDCLKEQILNKFPNSYLCETANSAEEAWEVIGELRAEEITLLVIVSDWLMPGVKGDEFLIDVHKKFPQIVKIILTGQADYAAIQRVQEQADLFRCLHKPWNTQELLTTINSGIERSLALYEANGDFVRG